MNSPDRRHFRIVNIPHTGSAGVESALWEGLPGKLRAELPETPAESGPVLAVVRNPWDWAVAVVAAFREQGHPQFAGRSWRECLLELAAEEGLDAASQVSRLCDVTGHPAAAWVVRWERLEEDLAEVCSRLGLAARKEGRAVAVPEEERPGYRERYDDETREAIGRKYAADAAVFGYEFDGIRPDEPAGILEEKELRQRWLGWLTRAGISALGWRADSREAPDGLHIHARYEGLKLWGWYLDDAARWWQYFRSDQPVRALEIGAFDGVSANMMLETLFIHPESELHTIDPYLPDPTTPELTPETRLHFEANHALGGRGTRLILHDGLSVEVLSWMTSTEGFWESFDFIYVDGSHLAKDVFIDAALSWHLLKVGGVLGFDDYEWGDPADPHGRPAPAIKAFEKVFGDRVALVFDGWRRFYRKLLP